MSFKTSCYSSGKCSYAAKNRHTAGKLRMSRHGSPLSSAYLRDEYDFDDENNDEDLDEDRENDDQEESDEGV
jgi:hypothetical protein